MMAKVYGNTENFPDLVLLVGVGQCAFTESVFSTASKRFPLHSVHFVH